MTQQFVSNLISLFLSVVPKTYIATVTEHFSGYIIVLFQIKHFHFHIQIDMFLLCVKSLQLKETYQFGEEEKNIIYIATTNKNHNKDVLTIPSTNNNEDKVIILISDS